MADITPPPELVGEWWIAWDALNEADQPRLEDFIAVKAAQWSADQELEACCEWLRERCTMTPIPEQMRAARRPKPPSLKEQALDALKNIEFAYPVSSFFDIIRRALEQLDD